MNLYSAKVDDGSVAPVEKETPVAKEAKRKLAPKKSTKKITAPVEPEPEIEASNDITNEEIIAELETVSDPEPVESVPESVPAAELQPAAKPVEVKKPKRKPKVPKAIAPPTPPSSEQTDNDDTEPPKWFMNYVSGMTNFRNQISEKKKPKRVLKGEADDYAKQQWKKPDLRQRVTDSVDSHLTKMYRQIFSNRT